MYPVILISGLPASGKTSVSQQLAKTFKKGFHLQVDQLRSMVVRGGISPDTATEWNDALEIQFRLERAAASVLASTYAEAGFSVIVDDVAVPANVLSHYEQLARQWPMLNFLLFPSVSETQRRLSERRHEFDDIFTNRLSMLHSHLESADKSEWNVLDTSDWTIDETVQAVIDRFDASAF